MVMTAITPDRGPLDRDERKRLRSVLHALSEAFHGPRALAVFQHHRPLRAALGVDVPREGDLAVAGDPARDAGRRAAGQGLHLLSRLRPRIVLQVALGQCAVWIRLWRAHVHALLPLALAARHPPRDFREAGQTRRRRHLDDDGAGVPRIHALEALLISLSTQSLRAVRHRAAVHVPVPAAVRFLRRQPAGAVFGVVDESRVVGRRRS